MSRNTLYLQSTTYLWHESGGSKCIRIGMWGFAILKSFGVPQTDASLYFDF